MDIQVKASHIEISRPKIPFFLLQSAIFLIVGFILLHTFLALVTMFELRHSAIILSGLYALIIVTLIGMAVYLLASFIDELWKQSLVRRVLEDAPYDYSNISFYRRVHQFTADGPNGEDMRLSLEPESPEKVGKRYVHAYTVKNIEEDH